MTISRQKIYLILTLLLVTAAYVLQQSHNILSNNDTYNYVLSGLYGVDTFSYQKFLDQFINSCPNASCKAYEISTIAPRYYYNYPIFGLLIQALHYLNIPSAIAIIGAITVTYLFIYYKIFRSISDEILNINLLPLFLGFFSPVLIFIRCLIGVDKKNILPIFITCTCAYLYYKDFGYNLSIVRYVSIYWAMYMYSKLIKGEKIVFSDFLMLYSHLLVGVLASIIILAAVMDFSNHRDKLKASINQLLIAVVLLVCFMGAFFSNPAFPIENISQRFLVILVSLALIVLAIFIASILKKYSKSSYLNSSHFLFKLFGIISLMALTYFIDKSGHQHKIFVLDYFLIPVTYIAIGFAVIQLEVTISPILFEKMAINIEKYRLAAVFLLFILLSTKVLIRFEKTVTQPLNLYTTSFDYDQDHLSRLDIGMLRRLLFVRYVYER